MIKKMFNYIPVFSDDLVNPSHFQHSKHNNNRNSLKHNSHNHTRNNMVNSANFSNNRNHPSEHRTSVHTDNYNVSSKNISINNKTKFNTNNVENSSIENEVLFEILGLKIYFDDLLIFSILLFLYQEGIQDDYLFIVLVLLLFS
ncbi:MAG: hypothetical protein IJ690_02125 [Clostridia bacterium]|nr:hypothetical protein [Clostridia bacterium]